MKSSRNLAPTPLYIRVVAFLLLPVQLLTCSPIIIYAASSQKSVAPPPPQSAVKGPPPIMDANGPAPVRTPKGVKAKKGTHDVVPFVPNLNFSNAPSDVEITYSHVFLEPLVPMKGDEAKGENAALASALLTYRSRKNFEDVSALSSFVSQFPTSRWNASLQMNMGLIQSQTGYFSGALASWSAAWKLAKGATDPSSKAVADRAIVEYLTLNAHFGQVEAMGQTFKELEGRQFQGLATDNIRILRKKMQWMEDNPQIAFRCGPFAINDILNIGKSGSDLTANATLLKATSTWQGTSLAQLNDLANAVKLNYQMAKRTPGSTIMIPSIMHWRLGHYSVVLAKKGEKYLLEDLTLSKTERLWVSSQVVDSESDGYFLVPDGTLPSGWQPLTDIQEAGNVWGRASIDDPGDIAVRGGKHWWWFFTGCKTIGVGDPTSGCLDDIVSNSTGVTGPQAPKSNDDDPCHHHGMAASSIFSALGTLCIEDSPLWYRAPLGPPMDFSVSYSDMEDNQPTTFAFTNLGQDWNFNWLSYLTVDTSQNVTVATRGGGTEVYAYSATDNITSPYTPDAYSQAQIVPVSNGVYERHLPDGSKEVFNQSDSTSGRIYMTQVIDPQGNSATVHYDTTFRIDHIYDALSQRTDIAYVSNTFGNVGYYKIATITDPFGRVAQFSYDSTGTLLMQIIDEIGMSSNFTYDSGSATDVNFINSLMTQYGRTAFTKYVPTGNDPSAKGLQITFPDGSQEALENWVSARTTYFWNKQAMATHAGDKKCAQVTQWCIGPDYSTQSSAMQFTLNPLEGTLSPLRGEVDYSYPDQDGYTSYLGSTNIPATVDRLLDDGTTHQTYQYQSNNLGHLTQVIDPAGRTFTMYYAANDIDLLEIRQTKGGANDLIGKWFYNSQHEPVESIDGSGQETTYTYNTAGQLTTVTDTQSHTTTLTYDGNGYLTQIDGPLAGSSDVTALTYDSYGRLGTMTDSEGYELAYDYDALNRPTVVTYPDGTYEQTTWNRLDPILSRDRLGRWTQRSYNSIRQLISETDPLGRTTTYSWCTCGALESLTDGAGNTTSWVRDLQGRLTQKVFADLSFISYTYENHTSRLKTVTDALSAVKTYSYNVDNTISSIGYTGGTTPTPTVNYTYDSNYPRITSVANTGTNSWGTLNYTYNAYITDPYGTPVLGGGKLQKMTNNVLANSDMTFTYDQLGRLVTKTVDGANNTSSYGYDAMSRVTGVTNPLSVVTSGTVAFGYNYFDSAKGTNRLSSITYPNGQQTNFSYYGNTGDQRLEQITNLNPDTSQLSQSSYAYDAAGKITQWTQQSGTSDPLQYALGYDKADQLTGAVQTDTTTSTVTGQYFYGYDSAGNRSSEQINNGVTQATSNNLNQVTGMGAGGAVRFQGTLSEASTVTVAGSPAQMTSGTSFVANPVLSTGTNTVAVVATDGSGNVQTNNYQVVIASGTGSRTLTYDANGSQLNNGAGQTYTWDAEKRLTAINYTSGPITQTQFTYDGLGRRVKIVEIGTGGSTKNLLWFPGAAQPCEERDGSDTVTKRFYEQGEQIAGANYYYTRDHLGSVREMTNSSGTIQAQYSYDPYGRQTQLAGTICSDFTYAGYYNHATSALNLTLYRAYNADIGRWISRDPIAEEGGVNLYEYVANNTLGGIDPLGASWSGWLTGAVLAAGLVAAVVVASPAVAMVVAVAAVGAVWSALSNGDPATGALAGSVGAAVSLVAGPVAGGAVGGGLGSYMGAVENGQSDNMAIGIGMVGAIGGGVLGLVSPFLQMKGLNTIAADGLATAISTVGGGALDLVTNLMSSPMSGANRHGVDTNFGDMGGNGDVPCN